MIAMLTTPALRATLGRGSAASAPEDGVVDMLIFQRLEAG
jgi:hypothetical protein